MKTEKEKMLAGEVYSAVDLQLIEELTEVKEIIHDYNLLRPSEKQKAREILRNVSIYTACHSTDPVERNSRREWAEPVSIGNNVWIGGSVTILPGVTIGDNVTIGAGSVVAKDIPSNSIAVGNPCKVIKKLESAL